MIAYSTLKIFCYIWFDKSGSRFTKNGSRFIQDLCEPGATFEKKWLPVPNQLFFPLKVYNMGNEKNFAFCIPYS